jgi:molecular chaperone DnaK (HSP70)
MVCDFGGGKCDISAVTIDVGISEIKSIESLEIGGEDLSNKLL